MSFFFCYLYLAFLCMYNYQSNISQLNFFFLVLNYEIYILTKGDLAMTNEIHTNVSNAMQQDITLQFLKGEI